MENSESTTYYIENLTIDSWALYLLPYFIKNRIIALQEAGDIYYFNNSELGLWLANFTLWFAKKKLKRADFNQAGTRDQDGNLVWMKTISDVASIQDGIKNNPEFQRAVENCERPNSSHLFLGKWIMCDDLVTTDAFLLQKFIFFVRSAFLRRTSKC